MESFRLHSGSVTVPFRFHPGSVLSKMSARVRFGDYVLDPITRELTRAGQPLPLTPKAFALLALLAERRPAAVSHEDLREALWPGMEAGGTTVGRVVNEVRAAVGGRGVPRRRVWAV